MLDLAANTSGVQPALYAQALTLGGIIAQMEADAARSRSLLEASVTAWRPLGDPVGLAMALANLGFDHVAGGDFEQADAILREALALARAGGEMFTTIAGDDFGTGMAILTGRPSHREGIANAN
jgi:hypothetical protein